MAGKCNAAGIDQHLMTSPAAHARLWKPCIVVGHDGVDLDLAFQSLLGLVNDFERGDHLPSRRQQCVHILRSPTVVLDVRDFQSLRLQRLGKGNHLFEMIHVLPVNHHVDGEGGSRSANQRRDLQFQRVGARSGDPVCTGLPRILETELNVIESRFDQSI